MLIRLIQAYVHGKSVHKTCAKNHFRTYKCRIVNINFYARYDKNLRSSECI